MNKLDYSVTCTVLSVSFSWKEILPKYANLNWSRSAECEQFAEFRFFPTRILMEPQGLYEYLTLSCIPKYLTVETSVDSMYTDSVLQKRKEASSIPTHTSHKIHWDSPSESTLDREFKLSHSQTKSNALSRRSHHFSWVHTAQWTLNLG